MTEPTRHRALRGVAALALVLAAAVPLLTQVVHEVPHVAWDGVLTSDYSGIENDVRTALDGHLLLGTPSRIGVRNLGPVGAYWSAPFYGLTGEGSGGMILGAWVANLLGAAVVVLVIKRVAGGRSAWLAAFVLALAQVRAGQAALSDFYNPAMTVPPTLVCVTASAAVARGRWSLLPVAVIAASIGAQMHVLAAPGLLVVLVAAIVGGTRRGRPTRRQLVVTVIAGAVLWAPMVLDQVAGSGNLARVVDVAHEGGLETEDALTGPPRLSAPVDSRAAMSVELTSLTAPRALLVGTLYPTPLHVEGARTAFGAALLAIAAAIAWIGRRRSPFGARLVLLGLIGALVTFATTAPFKRGVFPYYFAPLPAYGIAVLLGTALVVGASVHPAPVPRLAIAASFVVVGLVGFLTTTNQVTDVIGPRTNPALDRYLGAIEAELPSQCRSSGIAQRAENDQLAALWMVLVGLDRRDIPVSVPRRLEVPAGPGHRRTGHEALVVDLPTGAELREGGPFVIEPGACV